MDRLGDLRVPTYTLPDGRKPVVEIESMETE